VGWWGERVVPRVVDRSLSADEVMRRREAVCAGLRGRVLEIGFGSGLNLGALPPAVTTVDAVEPSALAWQMSAPRRARSPVRVERVGLDGQRLDVEDARYDAALVTFSLCTVPDPASALAEVRRALAPGAGLHFLEHGRSPDPGVLRWQRRLEPAQRRLAGGCHLTRDVVALVRAAGFDVEVLDEGYLAGPALNRPWGWLVRGRAST
jgi:SAM-dependent methyltransferase